MDSAQLSPAVERFLLPLTASNPDATVKIGRRAELFQQLLLNQLAIPATFILAAETIKTVFEHNHFLPLLAHFLSRPNLLTEAEQQRVSQELREAIHNFHFPEAILKAILKTYSREWEGRFLAIRPSFLSTDYPQQNLGQLYVQGEANLIESLIQVIAHAYLPELLIDRQKEWQTAQTIPLALLIQDMVKPQASGVAFTAHPTTGDQHTILIAGTWGVRNWLEHLSANLLQQADSFEVDTRNWQITQQHIQLKKTEYIYELDGLRQHQVKAAQQDQAVLTPNQAVQIAKAARQLAQNELRTQVIEWAIDTQVANDFLILNVFPLNDAVVSLPTPKTSTPQSTDERLATQTTILAVANTTRYSSLSTQLPAHHIGLIDSQTLWTQLPEHPQKLLDQHREDVIEKAIIESISQLSPLLSAHVIYRSLPLTSAEWRTLPSGENYDAPEVNPQLGYRGALRALHNFEIFNLETAALAKARTHTPSEISLALPFVRTSTEFALIKKHLVQQSAQAFLAQHLWLECNVPANLLEIEEYLPHQPEGFIINIPAIYALLVGIDGNNPDVAIHYPLDEMLIYRLLQEVKQKVATTPVKIYIWLSRSEQHFAERIVELGFDGVLVDPVIFDHIQQLIYTAEHNNQKGNQKVWP